MARSELVVHRPSGPLIAAVASMTGYAQEGLPPGVHRGLPSPFVTVVVTARDQLHVHEHVDPARPASAHVALAGGLHTRPVLLAHDGSQEGVQLSLTPSGTRALLGVPAGALAAWDGDLTDLLGRRADTLVDRVREAQGWAARFAAVEHVLAPADSPPPVPPEVRQAWRLLTRPGPTRVGDVARAVGWSVRLLEKRFRTHVGLTPGETARVARFHRARRLIAARWPTCGLADIAAACGYADQPHLSREFRALAGLSPRQWVDAEFAFVHDSAGTGG